MGGEFAAKDEIQPDGKYQPVLALMVPVSPATPSLPLNSPQSTCRSSSSQRQEEVLPVMIVFPFIYLLAAIIVCPCSWCFQLPKCPPARFHQPAI